MGLHNHYTGAASEFLVASYLSGKENDVFFPGTPSRADLIYTPVGGQAVRVQVKTTTRSKTGPYMYEQVRLVRKNGGKAYEVEEIDEMWIVGTHLWCFPADVVAGRTSLALCGNGPGGTRSKDYCPDDYIVVRGCWDNPLRDFFCHSK